MVCTDYEQFLTLCVIRFTLEFFCVFCKGLVCIFVCLCVSLDHFGFVFSKLVLLDLVYSAWSQEII